MVASASNRADRQRLRVLPGGGEPSGPSDEALIEAFENGDREVAELLYDRLIRVVDRTLYRVLGARVEDHDDLVQSAFEQIVITLSKRRFARACSLASWASAVTTNVALNALRSRRRERRVLDRGRDCEAVAERTHAADDVERRATARRELELLRQELAEMDAKKASTVLLHDVLGHELAEIAVLMGVSVAAAQSRLVRGRKQLMARVEKKLQEGQR